MKCHTLLLREMRLDVRSHLKEDVYNGFNQVVYAMRILYSLLVAFLLVIRCVLLVTRCVLLVTRCVFTRYSLRFYSLLTGFVLFTCCVFSPYSLLSYLLFVAFLLITKFFAIRSNFLTMSSFVA